MIKPDSTKKKSTPKAPRSNTRSQPPGKDCTKASVLSAAWCATTAKAAILSGKYSLLVVNYANPDMVGHTGSIPAAIKAVETVDQCVGRVVDAVLAKGGALVITADHGNCEQMIDATNGGPHLPATWVGWAGLAGLTFLYGTAATILFTVLPRLGAVGNSPIMNIEPVFAMVLAWLVLGQSIAPVQVLGALVVVGTVMVLGTRKGRK